MAEVPSTTSDRDGRQLAVHTRTLMLGLSLIAGSIAFLLLAGVVSGLDITDALFLIPMILAPLIGAALAWRFSTWANVVGLLLGLAAGVMSFFLAFGVFNPASFVEFTVGVAWVLGVLLVLFGGIASIVRRKDLRTAPSGSEALLRRGALGLVALALVVSVPLWLVSRDTVDDEVAAGLTEVTAANFAFEDVTADAGESILVTNSDPFHHTFTIDELGIDVDLLPGDEVVVALPDAPGTYTYYCIPHSMDAGNGEDDMAAEIVVQ